MASNYPAKYLLFNQQMSKNLAIVMQIEGVSDLFGISDTFTTVKYGDPGLVYGEPGLIYGGLRRISGVGGGLNVKAYIVLDSSLVINQRIEPEQGKGNLATVTITLIDKNGEVSKLVAPGVVIDEILLKRQVRLWLGFTQTSFPDDYLLIYQGYFTSVDCPPTLVKLQISDSTTKKRQPICNTPNTSLVGNIDAVTTTINMIDNTGFHHQILGPDSTFDPIVRTYIQIDSEWMEYTSSGFVSDTQMTVLRGGSNSLGTTPASHTSGTSIANGVQLGGNTDGVNPITLALKLLLSGWDGPCETNIPTPSFVFTGSVFVNNAFVLGSDPTTQSVLDASLDIGLTVGDFFSISGATNPSNNVSGQITGFEADVSGKLSIILTNQTFVHEVGSPAVASFRSKYDTLPTTCGAKCRMRDVDVATHEMVRDKYFNTGTANMNFFYSQAIQAKDAIDTNIFLPIGCYGISRYGRISISVTKPPLPGIGKLVELNWTNILDPDKIHVTRSTNSRSFYNLVSFEYGQDPASGNFTLLDQFLDTTSSNIFDQISKLPITAPGMTERNKPLVGQRGRALLNRYKQCVIIIELTVNWSVGSLIEVSDIVLLRDQGTLKIMNFATGERDIGLQMWEVIDRSFNIVAGNVKLKIMGGLGFNVDSRFGLYSPSSRIDAGATTTTVPVKPSYGQPDLAHEIAKWSPFLGLEVEIHSFDYSNRDIVTLVSIDSMGLMTVSPALTFTPASDDIVDIRPYPTSTDPNLDKTYKNLYAFFTPTIPVVSGVSTTQFNVSLVDAAKMTVGNTIVLVNDQAMSPYSVISNEVAVQSIVGTLVTTAKPITDSSTNLAFTPDNTFSVIGVGFKDGLSYYRYD